MIEIFKDIKGYEGLYQVSNLGRVKSLGNNKTRKERILKQGKNKAGYLQVGLCKDGKSERFLVHRLVAEAFISNPTDLPQVGHLDENPSNNQVKNLCWCSAKDNRNWGTHNEKLSKSMTNNPNISTPIKCLDLETNETSYYPSIIEASRQFQIQSMTIWRYIYKYSKSYKNRFIFSEINK